MEQSRPLLEFDEPSHIYRWSGRVVPSVTTVIKDLTDYSRIPPAVLEKARQEGVQIHKMVELDCRQELDESTLPEWIEPHFAAWRKFVAHKRIEVLLSEHRVFHPGFWYAGTLDLLVYMDGELSLIDVKRSFAGGKAIGVQLAGYSGALAVEMGKKPKPIRRYGLRLKPNGEPQLREFINPTDWNVFLACLTVRNFKESEE